MEPKVHVAYLCLKEPAAGPIPEPGESLHILKLYIFKLYIPSCAPRSSESCKLVVVFYFACA
jgi:hypothetical protein